LKTPKHTWSNIWKIPNVCGGKIIVFILGRESKAIALREMCTGQLSMRKTAGPIHLSACLPELFDSRYHDITQGVVKEFCIYVRTSPAVNFGINCFFNLIAKDSKSGSIG
jgi:hypothetical protein